MHGRHFGCIMVGTRTNCSTSSGPPISDVLNNPSISSFHHGISWPSGPGMKHRLSDTDTLAKKGKRRTSENHLAGASAMKNLSCQEKSLGDIIFVRSRMFYSKPAYNARGKVLFGLPHIRMYYPFTAILWQNDILLYRGLFCVVFMYIPSFSLEMLRSYQSARCLQSLPKHRRTRPPHLKIHLSAPVRSSQCFHF
jgi:hypothetical protein